MIDVFDAPIGDPDSDLLGMVSYATRLATLISSVQPPFTIGIYGEWGSGKTSFVRLVRHFLENPAASGAPMPLKFVEFTAWRHRTADELWRALILEIARTLYEIPEAPTAAVPADPGAIGWLSALLTRDALVLRDAPPEPTPEEELDALMVRLGRTLKGGISRSADQGLELDQQAVVTTLAQAAIAAVSTVSPLFAGVRALFGLEPKLDPEKLLRKAEDASISERTESIEEFQALFRDMLRRKAEGKRVCVFVDDLDRCMPDAALDLLEAIKLFLGDAPCIFIVAVDEQLISQGLRLRFKGLAGEGGDPAGISVLKGREYFEKIIQLGIRVPQRTPEQTHRLISAHFPEWTPATDVIHAAVGSNPRRVKQYCTWLSYKYDVARTLDKADPPSHELFKKLVELRTWHEPCARLLADLARDAQAYPGAMGELERGLHESSVDRPDESVRDGFADERQRKLYDIAVQSGPLFALFGLDEPPHLSKEAASAVAVSLRLAEVKPDPENMLSVDDACFMRIARTAARRGDSTPGLLLREDLARWLALRRRHPAIAERACARWPSSPRTIRRGAGGWRSSRPRWSAPPTRSRPRRRRRAKSWRRWPPIPRSRSAAGGRSSWGRRASLRCCAARSWPLVRWESSPSRASPETSRRIRWPAPWPNVSSSRSSAPRRRSLDRTLSPSPRPGTELTIRSEIAAHLIRRRMFAKLDALAYRWPDLALLLRTNRGGLLTLERQHVEAQALPEALEKQWDRYRRDEQLLEVFRLRPSFGDIP